MIQTVAAVLLAAALALVHPQAAAAHAFLVQSSPQAGARLSSSPNVIRLRFTEPVLDPKIGLHRADGRAVRTGRLELADGRLLAVLPVSRLPRAVYVVSWQVVSADDGHVTAGEFAFAVGLSGAVSIPAPSAQGSIDWAQTAARWLLLMGLLVAFGGLISERLLWRTNAWSDALMLPRLPLAGPLAVAAAGTLAEVALVWSRTGAASLLGSRVGIVAILPLLLITYALWISWVHWARPWLFLPVGLALGIAAAGGHPAAVPGWWATPANVLHVLAAGVWVGGLGHTLLVLWCLRGIEGSGPVVWAGLRRYSNLAVIAVPVALLGGLPVALSEFSVPSQLILTSYGRVLVVKAVLVAGALVAAWLARRRLAAAALQGLDRVRRLAGLEGGLVLAVVTVAAVLANTLPPSRTPTAAANLLGPPPLSEPALYLADLDGSLAVYLAVTPKRIRVQVIAPSGQPATTGPIEIEGVEPNGRGFSIQPRSCGAGCATAAFALPNGTSTMAITVEAHRQWGGGTVRFTIPWPPEPGDAAQLVRVVTAMREQPQIVLTERVSSGLGHVAQHTYTLTGQQFVDYIDDLYTRGGVKDIHLISTGAGGQALTFFLPGSWIWYQLELDPGGRLRSETIVDPGHLILRTFAYPDG